jgi:DNA repair protein RadC
MCLLIAEHLARRTSRARTGLLDSSNGLWNHGGGSELSDHRPARLGHFSPSASSSSIRQRSILANLVATVAPNSAETATQKLLSEFGSIGRTLRQNDEAKRRILGDDPAILGLLNATRDALDESLRSDILGHRVDGSLASLRDYLVLTMGSLCEETLRVLFLDRSSRILAEEQLAIGTIDRVPIYPRVIFRRALELSASAVLLVHNHPSGDPAPSDDDMRATRTMCKVGAALDVRVEDHLIVAGSRCISLRDQGILQ